MIKNDYELKRHTEVLINEIRNRNLRFDKKIR
jgi:hypothetical protein